jgi:hypothetical protein
MAEPALDLHGRTSRGRGVSPVVAFLVVATSVAAVLAVALSERQEGYEASAVIRLANSSAADTITTPSEHAIREAFARQYTAATVDDSNEEIVGSAESSSNKLGGSKHVVIAVRSADHGSLPARLNNAARQVVDAQNAAVAAEMTAQLQALKQQVATRRDEHASAAKTLEDLEIRMGSSEQSVKGNVTSGTTTTPETNNTRENAREVNPQWVLLRDEVAALEAKVSELRGRFTEQHPEVHHAVMAFAERSSTFEATPQYLGAVDAPQDDSNSDDSHTIASPENPPLLAPQSDAVADAAPDRAEVETARAKVATASEALDKSWAAEKAAEQRQIELAAVGPWRFDAADSVRTVASGATQTPWLIVLGASLSAGLVVSLLARGMSPVIQSREDAVAALGLQVVGMVRTEDPAPPLPSDRGVVSAQWLTGAGVVAIGAVVVIAAFAANGNGIGLEELRRDPAVLLSLSRDWLAERLG